MKSVTTLVEDQKQSWKPSRKSCLHSKFVVYISSIVFIHTVCVSCVLPLLTCCLKYKTLFPSGMRAEALGIFFWQMVISN